MGAPGFRGFGLGARARRTGRYQSAREYVRSSAEQAVVLIKVRLVPSMRPLLWREGCARQRRRQAGGQGCRL